MWPYRNLLFTAFLLFCTAAYSQQQDITFHLSNELLNGKTILKVKRDFHDSYLWVLAKNNQVYRINSNNLAVDDYTPKFAAYNNLQFIDIAGRSKDTVFIATNSTNVIQYKNGATRLIGTADGMPDIVNSVGIDKNLNYQENYIGHCLMIGTASGFCRYNMDNEQAVEVVQTGNSQIFEATYRKEMYKDSSDAYTSALTGDTIQYLPVVHSTFQYGIAIGYLWEGGNQFGYKINTAYYTSAVLQEQGDETDLTDLFWGNSRGMFQNTDNLSYNSTKSSHAHYLDGINVNKITSIYGLDAFGDNPTQTNPGYTKENLLVGTDAGLYFSSSVYNGFVYNNGLTTYLRQFLLFHYDELGNIRVNDICVNTSSTTMPVCEDGVWVACDNGLYLIKPDYAQFWNKQTSQAIQFDGQANTVTQTKICAGTTITAITNPGFYTNISVQWYKDGQELPGQSQNSLVINASGDYYSVLYDPCGGVHLESNHLTVQVISAPVFSFNYPDKLQYCNSSSTTLETDNNPQYTYRWYTNGVLNGVTTYNYAVTQSGKYKVEVSACTASWVSSKEIEVDLVNLPVPTISADKTQYCAGDNAVLSLNIPADPGYTINWYKDGNIINADDNQTSINATNDGSYSVMLISTIANCTQASNTQQIAFTPAPVFTFNYPDKLVYCDGTPVTLTAQGSSTYNYRWYTNGVLNGDITPTANITQSGKYKVEVSACDGSWVPSKEVQVDINKIPTPTLQADKPSYCMGDNATLTAGISTDPSYTINWYKDNVLLTANSNQTSLVVNESGSYSSSVTSNELNTDGTTCALTATAQNIIFNPPPTVSIQKIVTTTLCDGQTVDLKVSYNTGTVKWSNGQSSDLITVGTSGSYSATVTSVAGCTTSSDINVQFFPNPVLNLPGYAVCIPSKKTATLTAPEGMASYTWNGQSGTNTFIVDHPETVTLTITDAHGCQATQHVQVVDECPNISIPNAFTPNGDGINDTWDIVGLEYDPTSTVKIFTRNGQQIFDSKGYPKPWAGDYKGKQLPPGVYYYIIKAKNNSQTYSGPVTIIY